MIIKNRCHKIISAINKKMGKNILLSFPEKIENKKYKIISSGSLKLNRITGINGYPWGRIIEIYGPESTGKSTLGLHAIAEAQKLGLQGAYIDVENALDTSYMAKIGIDNQKLIISQPNYGEEALDVLESLVNSQKVNLIIVDSVAALVPLAELESRITDQQMALQARLMSKALRRLNALLTIKKNCTIIFINQIRENVQILFGNKEISSGGKALKFYSSMRIEIRKNSILKVNNEIIGQKIRVKITKNKLAPPFQITYLDLIYGKGFDLVGEIIDLGLKKKLLIRKGSWFYNENKQLANGYNELRNKIINDSKLLASITNKLI